MLSPVRAGYNSAGVFNPAASAPLEKAGMRLVTTLKTPHFSAGLFFAEIKQKHNAHPVHNKLTNTSYPQNGNL